MEDGQDNNGQAAQQPTIGTGIKQKHKKEKKKGGRAPQRTGRTTTDRQHNDRGDAQRQTGNTTTTGRQHNNRQATQRWVTMSKIEKWVKPLGDVTCFRGRTPW